MLASFYIYFYRNIQSNNLQSKISEHTQIYISILQRLQLQPRHVQRWEMEDVMEESRCCLPYASRQADGKSYSYCRCQVLSSSVARVAGIALGLQWVSSATVNLPALIHRAATHQKRRSVKKAHQAFRTIYDLQKRITHV